MWSKYMPIVLLIFFFNSVLLPHGLLFSALLTPVFIYWLWKSHSLKHLAFAGLGIFLLDCFHYSNGADLKALLISSGLFFSSITFGIATWKWLKSEQNPKWLFAGLLKWNTMFVILAILILPFGFGRAIMWYEIAISPGIASFPRLKLFTYEAAYYALLFAPIFLYYFWQILLGMERRWLMIALAIIFPLVLSLSFGVSGALALALGMSILIHSNYLLIESTFRRKLFYSGSFALVLIFILLIAYPHNPVFERVANIFQGQDTSARGRLFESFMFAFDLANSKSIWLGVGLGQIKILGHDLIVNFYQYKGDFAEIVRIPNALGELLATYGLIGLFTKICVEIYLFFKYKLYSNYFNLSLFLFIFIYQFTGSYLVNTAELMLWAGAFAISLPEFDTPFNKSKQYEGRVH